MVSLSSYPTRTQSPCWTNLIKHIPKAFGLTPLSVIEGEIPEGVRGDLYKIAPARLERGGQRVGHWFDGDGAILAINFQDSGVTGRYRYVETAEYLAEEKMGKLLFGGYGRTPSGSIWQNFTLPMKNCPNTGLLCLPDRLLALWEGGLPHRLDLETLETMGVENLGTLPEDAPYGVHPKIDSLTGDIYNFGVTYGRKGFLQLYRSDASGKIQQQAAIALEGLPLIHDFVMVGNYLVFFIPPVHLNPLPFLTKQKSFSDSLSWQPKKGTQILVVDRRTFAVVSRGKTEPWFQWRFGQSYLELGNTVVINLIRYPDFQINQFLKEVSHGETKTFAKGTLWQIRLDPQTGQILTNQPLLQRSCEFPAFAPQEESQPQPYTYLSAHRSERDLPQELFNTIARFDHQTGELIEAQFETGVYPGSPVYVSDGKNAAKGWILVEVFNGIKDSSELWLFDAINWDRKPICKIALPSLVPLSFKGIWTSDKLRA
jgi:carotenoid cleavage dioxygenase-like enzyme